MKKFLFALVVLFSTVSFSQNQTLTGIKTFTSPPKFLNLQFSGTNTKYLTLSALNQLQWSTLNPIAPVTPTFAQVLAAGKQSVNNSTAHFSLVGNNISANYFTGYTNIVDTNTGNNSTYGSSGFNNNNNDGRVADLGFAQGLRLRTVAGGGTVTLKSTNVTANIALEWPNNSGTVITDAPSDGTPYVRQDGSWIAPSGGGGSSTLQDVLTAGSHIQSYSEISFGDDIAYNVSLNGTRLNRFGIEKIGGTDVTDLGIVALRSNSSEPYLNYVRISSGTTKNIKIGVENVTNTNVDLQYTGKTGNIPSLNTTAPSSSTDTGFVGEIRVTSTYIYTCIATNTWVRAAMATW
jgi:hypothetical protein